MSEIRIVGPGKTRGYPYPVCKKSSYTMVCPSVQRDNPRDFIPWIQKIHEGENPCAKARGLSPRTGGQTMI